MDKVKVHRVNFFKREPTAIHSLAYDETTSQLAVSRSDFSIEIWDLKQNPFLQRVIPGHPSYSVETVVWSKGRLFSAGLHGHIIEHDLQTLQHKEVVVVTTSCSVWCLAVDKGHTLLAAGTEDGRVCIYNISSYNLDFNKLLSKQEGRILCLDWHESGDFLVTGSIDVIRIWNVKTGQIAERIIVGRSEKNVETIVWCIAVTSDMTVISGDSRGRTCFWDGKMGTLMSSSVAHKADVLAVCLSNDENVVYTTGVDPVIIMFVKSQTQLGSNEQSKKKWMKSVQRVIHTHDVRALQFAGEYLVSGGVDTNLVFSKYPPKTVIPYSFFSQVSYMSISHKASLIMLKYSQQLEVWKLGKTIAKSVTDGEQLPLHINPVMHLLLKSKSNECIICSAISVDGRWIAYSSLNHLRLFYLSKDDDESSQILSVQKVKFLPDEVMASTAMIFTTSGKLVVSSFSGKIQVLDCHLTQSKVILNLDSGLIGIHLLAVSNENSFLAAGAHDGNISIYNMSTGQIYSRLPSYKCQATAMEFDIESENLVAVYSDRKIVEYDLKKQAYSDWCRKKCMKDFQDTSPYTIRGITFSPQNKSLLFLHDEVALYVINKSLIPEHNKKRLKGSDNSLEVDEVVHFKSIKKYRHLLHFSLLKDDEMVALEVKPGDIHCSLPPPLYRKKYGT